MGQKTFTANGVESGATVDWSFSVSPPGAITITDPSNGTGQGTSITITHTDPASGVTATITAVATKRNVKGTDNATDCCAASPTPGECIDQTMVTVGGCPSYIRTNATSFKPPQAQTNRPSSGTFPVVLSAVIQIWEEDVSDSQLSLLSYDVTLTYTGTTSAYPGTIDFEEITWIDARTVCVRASATATYTGLGGGNDFREASLNFNIYCDGQPKWTSWNYTNIGKTMIANNKKFKFPDDYVVGELTSTIPPCGGYISCYSSVKNHLLHVSPGEAITGTASSDGCCSGDWSINTDSEAYKAGLRISPSGEFSGSIATVGSYHFYLYRTTCGSGGPCKGTGTCQSGNHIYVE